MAKTPPPVPPRRKPAAASGRTPPSPPTRAKKSGPENDALVAQQNASRRRAYVEPTNVHGTVSQRLARPASEARVEHARETNSRVSDQVSKGGHLGKDPQDRSLGSWRSSDKGYRKP